MRLDVLNHIAEVQKEQRRSTYHPPLVKKKQRVVAKAEKNGPVHVYSEEELLAERLKRFGCNKQYRVTFSKLTTARINPVKW